MAKRKKKPILIRIGVIENATECPISGGLKTILVTVRTTPRTRFSNHMTKASIANLLPNLAVDHTWLVGKPCYYRIQRGCIRQLDSLVKV